MANERLEAQNKANMLKPEMVGHKYKHFKGGVYVIDNIGIHSETAELFVVYSNEHNPDLTWCRPLDMFLSEVDHEKYPDVTQKLRFEKMDKI